MAKIVDFAPNHQATQALSHQATNGFTQITIAAIICDQTNRAKAHQVSRKKNYDTPTFVHAARQLHGARYRYARAYYTNLNASITITCPEHGDVQVIAKHHLDPSKLQGCRKCRWKYKGPASLGLESKDTRAMLDCGIEYDVLEVRRFQLEQYTKLELLKQEAYRIREEAKRVRAELAAGTPSKQTLLAPLLKLGYSLEDAEKLFKRSTDLDIPT